jgi:hypothetical protein
MDIRQLVEEARQRDVIDISPDAMVGRVQNELVKLGWKHKDHGKSSASVQNRVYDNPKIKRVGINLSWSTSGTVMAAFYVDHLSTIDSGGPLQYQNRFKSLTDEEFAAHLDDMARDLNDNHPGFEI